MTRYYRLEGHQAVPCEMMEWAREFRGSHHVGNDVAGDVRVSTVFLGLNHSFGCGPPLIFETMIFGGPHDGYQERYSTWDEAAAGHERALHLIRSGNDD